MSTCLTQYEIRQVFCLSLYSFSGPFKTYIFDEASSNLYIFLEIISIAKKSTANIEADLYIFHDNRLPAKKFDGFHKEIR